jgi:hypothetical protein
MKTQQIRIVYDTPKHLAIIIYDVKTLITILSRAKLSAAIWSHERYMPQTDAYLINQWAHLSKLTDSTQHLNSVHDAWYTPYIVRDQDIAATIHPGWHYTDKSFTRIYWYLDIGLNYVHSEHNLPPMAVHLRNTVREMIA